MNPFFRVLLGFFVMFVGFLFVWKNEKTFRLIGRIDFAERKFGYGGTRLFLKLVGVMIVFIGMFIMTNIISDILTSFASIFVRT
ncbi:MAG: hypothetical protein UU08_C0016G0004 [Candidatus Uhrbacteria bacterium GW2011_GWE2_40_58]|nr:MAG: hypothetical protein UT94_C0021G0004 [Candidatus Uhrbacteria bacterium GW2011_GWF2_40_263]KKR67476.1 MAG: hypothetical protein UU08_C0016G0004 [Candidatus Uhrbacteria bacterium GW2011_GWE2_40_58]OGL94223.1 MAG: hypothetical protein A2239_03785 [Candidatus Uhrbacteria bacterium RIFOXYA2_FULL_40_9]OGL98072.1 MAG: hypothetical protein A2332_01690 [Candidatus Uhrbacteria bacterium RIFOXYB2_FULL_41_18]HBK35198.1 hypothetical protein [Candidatus Uhrbacteria bacterium]